jgi:hypothetical protein
VISSISLVFHLDIVIGDEAGVERIRGHRRRCHAAPESAIGGQHLIRRVLGIGFREKPVSNQKSFLPRPMPELMGLSANPKGHNRPDSTTEAVGCIFAEASWKYWIGTILLGLELTNLRAERRTIEDTIEDWWVDLNLLDLAAVGVANLRFRT